MNQEQQQVGRLHQVGRSYLHSSVRDSGIVVENIWLWRHSSVYRRVPFFFQPVERITLMIPLVFSEGEDSGLCSRCPYKLHESIAVLSEAS